MSYGLLGKPHLIIRNKRNQSLHLETHLTYTALIIPNSLNRIIWHNLLNRIKY